MCGTNSDCGPCKSGGCGEVAKNKANPFIDKMRIKVVSKGKHKKPKPGTEEARAAAIKRRLARTQ